MADKRDYYETLGVGKSATDSDLKRAYRKLAKQYHPDANPGNTEAEAKFKELSEAYAILSDEEKRAAYDRYGHRAFEADGAGGGGFHFNMGDMGDIFEGLFRGGFSGFGGGTSHRRTGPRNGGDVQVQVQITLEEAVFGTTKTVSYHTIDNCTTCKGVGAKPGTQPETCPKCQGVGRLSISQPGSGFLSMFSTTCPVCEGDGQIIKNPCGDCRGVGKVNVAKSFNAKIPKGIDHGEYFKERGRGSAGERGGRSGDLLVVVLVRPHKIFSRQGNNLFLNVPITFVQAALGDEISIPMLDGSEEKQVIKPGTQPGTKLPIKGKGVTRGSFGAGDLVVTLNVSVPTQLNDKQKEHLLAFNDAMGDEYKYNKKNFFEKIKDSFNK